MGVEASSDSRSVLTRATRHLRGEKDGRAHSRPAFLFPTL